MILDHISGSELWIWILINQYVKVTKWQQSSSSQSLGPIVHHRAEGEKAVCRHLTRILWEKLYVWLFIHADFQADRRLRSIYFVMQMCTGPFSDIWLLLVLSLWNKPRIECIDFNRVVAWPLGTIQRFDLPLSAGGRGGGGLHGSIEWSRPKHQSQPDYLNVYRTGWESIFSTCIGIKIWNITSYFNTFFV